VTAFAPLAPATRAAPPRTFGRFTLRLLLGKSERTMVWLVYDPRNDQELMITMPRVPPIDAAALAAWQLQARAAARLDHPQLAHVVEIGVHEHWPYIACDRALGVTLAEWLAEQPLPAPENSVAWIAEALEGLAFAHEAGLVHGDPQLAHLIVDAEGRIRLMGLGAAPEPARPDPEDAVAAQRAMTIDPAALRAQREAAQRDVLAIGVLLHQLLSGTPPLEEPDTARVIQRIVPVGREVVKLPWSTPHPIPEALRAIGDRATVAHERHRYLGARSLLRALAGWRSANADDQGGALALLIDRLRTVGHLPAMPGAMAAVARLAGAAEVERTDEMATQILQDMALSFEMLRLVNSAQVQATQAAGNGPVLTIRRAIALLGTDGIRRAANALRAWPGPLSDDNATALRRLIDRVRFAGHLAQALRPAGYDAEVVYLVAAMQNLGRLLVEYHFADEAEQVRRLMQSLPPPADAEPGTKGRPGLGEEAAAQAVLGVEIESLGAAVARHWGLGSEVQHLIRRLPANKPVRQPDSDLDVLRITASAANEALDAVAGAGAVPAELERIAARYARTLRVDAKSLREALHSAQAALRSGSAPASQPQTQVPAEAPAVDASP
jgi:non-specific serine/threonine protein kinase